MFRSGGHGKTFSSCLKVVHRVFWGVCRSRPLFIFSFYTDALMFACRIYSSRSLWNVPPQSVTDPSPCLTAVQVFFSLKPVPFLLQTLTEAKEFYFNLISPHNVFPECTGASVDALLWIQWWGRGEVSFRWLPRGGHICAGVEWTAHPESAKSKITHVLTCK